MVNLGASLRFARIHLNVCLSSVPRTGSCKKNVELKDTFESITWRLDGKLQFLVSLLAMFYIKEAYLGLIVL
jgi:hypothetical protein